MPRKTKPCGRTDILLDEQDRHLLKWNWNSSKKSSYLRARVSGSGVILLHRLIMGAKLGEFVDHINGNPLDCRRSNMRICDRASNNFNKMPRSDSTAPYKGITKKRNGKWLAQIQARRVHRIIGIFDTPEEAAIAYDKAAIELHGEFACINGLGNTATGSSIRVVKTA